MTKFSFLKYVFSLYILLFLVSCEQDDDSSTKEDYNPHITLEGEDNMRDLGGYIGQNGKTVAYKKLFRSGELSSLTNTDQNTLTRLGLQQVFDLRSDAEREAEPDRLPSSIVHYALALSENTSVEDDPTLSYEEQMQLFMQQIMTGAITVNDIMLETYVVDSLKIAHWKEVFNKLETGKSSLWHCTAGKDRAGMTTVLVLSSLGVSEETCIEDFMKSNEYLAEYIETTTSQIEAAYGSQASNAIRPLFGVEQSWIEAFIHDINTNHGGMTAFLQELEVDIKTMQENFLEN